MRDPLVFSDGKFYWRFDFLKSSGSEGSLNFKKITDLAALTQIVFAFEVRSKIYKNFFIVRRKF